MRPGLRGRCCWSPPQARRAISAGRAASGPPPRPWGRLSSCLRASQLSARLAGALGTAPQPAPRLPELLTPRSPRNVLTSSPPQSWLHGDPARGPPSCHGLGFGPKTASDDIHTVPATPPAPRYTTPQHSPSPPPHPGSPCPRPCKHRLRRRCSPLPTLEPLREPPWSPAGFGCLGVWN